MNPDMTTDSDPTGEPPTAGAGVAVTRSEERLRVHLQRRPYERVMVRKVVVTEQVTLTVDVRREELRVTRIPVSEATGEVADADVEGVDAPGLVDAEVVTLVLAAERPVVTLETVPLERVQILKEVITLTQQVDADVRSERVQVDRGPAAKET